MTQNLGDTIRRKQQRIVALREEIAALQAELKDARSILAGKQPREEDEVAMPPIAGKGSVVVPHRRAQREQSTGRTRPIKEGSTVWWARRLLRIWKHDEHIDTIVSEIARAMTQPVSKATVVSNLSRYVKRGDTFTHPAENRYGLIDYNEDEMSKAG